ncbi:hypothetical protein ZIOFF_004354 [Zingiber officinale]|uniref:Pentatricopeptide repeat-containing protein n=1 Tax=Zingiber officinale TaxID=94328 RepID=A0A8J5HZ05_ZINOF|nr:hypothetical protein ZIOFF_004354 [Zingiber officinale]
MEMKWSGIRLTLRNYNALIGGFLRKCQLLMANRMLVEMSKEGVEWNRQTELLHISSWIPMSVNSRSLEDTCLIYMDNDIRKKAMNLVMKMRELGIVPVKTKLRGHQNKITSLSFSASLNVLESAGADAQHCVWSIDAREMKKAHVADSASLNLVPRTGLRPKLFDSQAMTLLHGRTALELAAVLPCNNAMACESKSFGLKPVLGTKLREALSATTPFSSPGHLYSKHNAEYDQQLKVLEDTLEVKMLEDTTLK